MENDVIYVTFAGRLFQSEGALNMKDLLPIATVTVGDGNESTA